MVKKNQSSANDEFVTKVGRAATLVVVGSVLVILGAVVYKFVTWLV